jgi:hypothetical protein
MSRRASTAGRSDSYTRDRSRHAPGAMALVWITVARGVMSDCPRARARVSHDRAPAALVNFMGLCWILNGIFTLQLGLAAEGSGRRLALAAGATGRSTEDEE